jgi:hypothetical protein
MEFLKGITFTIALLLVGALFVFLGIAGTFTISGVNYAIQQPFLRLTMGVIGATSLLLACILEIRSRGGSKKATHVGLDDLFFTFNAGPISFEDLVRDAKQVSLLTRTGVNLLSQYSHVFQEIMEKGCSLRLLLLDPSSESCAHVYGAKKIFEKNVSKAFFHIEALQAVAGHLLEVRTTKHAPTFGMILVERKDTRTSALQIQFNFYHSVVGNDRPEFIITQESKWFDVFKSEFAALWEGAHPLTIKAES